MLPVARNIESVALLAPGTVLGDSGFGEEKELISFGGASVGENAYYIDGLNVTNFRNGLGGSSVPFEFYDQFQIKTGGIVLSLAVLWGSIQCCYQEGH